MGHRVESLDGRVKYLTDGAVLSEVRPPERDVLCGPGATELMEDFWFPLRWFEDLTSLAGQYGASIKLTRGNASPYGDEECEVWFYRQEEARIYIPTNERGVLYTFDVVTTFCHELAHRLQHLALTRDGSEFLFEGDDAHERQANRIGRVLSTLYFSHLVEQEGWENDVKDSLSPI